MTVKFSEDVIPLTDLKINPGKVLRHIAEVHRATLLTSCGRAIAAIQSIDDFEATEEERAFMRAVLAGLNVLEAGQEVSLKHTKARLAL